MLALVLAVAVERVRGLALLLAPVGEHKMRRWGPAQVLMQQKSPGSVRKNLQQRGSRLAIALEPSLLQRLSLEGTPAKKQKARKNGCPQATG